MAIPKPLALLVRCTFKKGDFVLSISSRDFGSKRLTQLSLAFLLSTSAVCSSQAEEYLNGIKWEEPKIITPGATNSAPPSDAVILFDGKDLSKWKNAESWKVEDGVMVCGKKAISSVQEFGDCQLHIEWTAPEPHGETSQKRGNSGVFLMGKYEIQVLDSYDNVTYFDGQAGAIYKQTPPMVNAMRKPGEWNTYDILWTCPRFKTDGSLESPAYITAIHNGVVILNHFALQGDTPFNRPPKYEAHPPKGPIGIQDHGNPVKFRNIWVREIAPAAGVQEREPFIRKGDIDTPISQIKEIKKAKKK